MTFTDAQLERAYEPLMEGKLFVEMQEELKFPKENLAQLRAAMFERHGEVQIRERLKAIMETKRTGRKPDAQKQGMLDRARLLRKVLNILNQIVDMPTLTVADIDRLETILSEYLVAVNAKRAAIAGAEPKTDTGVETPKPE